MPESRIPALSTVESPPPNPELTYGQLKGGEIVDSGGQAIVRRASMAGPNPPNTVAVKEPLAPSKTIGRETTEAFLKEAKTWQTLARREREHQVHDTDHIVGVVAIGDDAPWIALEYMDGGSLVDRLESDPDGLPLEQALWIAECLCQGVKLAHDNGIAHLDLKPANVLFRSTPGEQWDVPKIADWGLSRTLLEDSRSMEMFSTEYAAPEQFDSEQFGRPDKYTDVYQLGAIVYELLTGRPPYTGGQASVMHDVVYGDAPEPPSILRPTLPSALDDVVLRALSAEKSQRYRGSIDRLEEAIHGIRRSDSSSTSGGDNRLSDARAIHTDTAIWAMQRKDLARTGHHPTTSGPKTDVTTKWVFETEKSKLQEPIVADGNIYFGNSNRLYAVDAKNGFEEWHVTMDEFVYGTPLFLDGTVYAGGDKLYALDAERGSELWSYQFAKGVAPWASPMIHHETLYFNAKTSFQAVHAKEGTNKWNVLTGYNMKSTPAMVGNTIVIAGVGINGSTVSALDAESGDERWQAEIEHSLNSSLAIADGCVYFGSWGGYIHALDVTDGTEQWRYKTGDRIVSSPAVANGTVYTGSNDGSVYAIDAASGTLQWSFEAGTRVRSSPSIADGLVYIGCDDQNVYALDGDNGSERWHFDTGAQVETTPVVVEGTVYVGNENSLLALTER